MSEEKEDNLDTHIALTTSVIAVFLAISGIMGNNADNDTILFRAESNDKWSYFQSKSIKQNMLENSLEHFEVERTRAQNDPATTTLIDEKIKKIKDDIKRYDNEKNEIKGDAEAAGKTSTQAAKQGDTYDLAEGFYQVSIVLAAVSAVVKNRDRKSVV